MGTRNRNSLWEFQLRFVTTTCKDWLPLLNSDEVMRIMADSIKYLNDKYKVEVLAYVFMKNHVHLILLFNEGKDLSSYMRDFKKFTSVQIRKHHEEKKNHELVELIRYVRGKQKLKVWQDRFDDFCITRYDTFLTKLNYIHNNPVVLPERKSWQYRHLRYVNVNL